MAKITIEQEGKETQVLELETFLVAGEQEIGSGMTLFMEGLSTADLSVLSALIAGYVYNFFFQKPQDN